MLCNLGDFCRSPGEHRYRLAQREHRDQSAAVSRNSLRFRAIRSTTLHRWMPTISFTTACTGSIRTTTGTPAPGTTALGALCEPEVVPLYILRIPVRYYRQPPSYFRGWQPNAPPRWGQHWGPEWERHRSGWDTWNRSSVPARAPLPVYQRQYSGDRYPTGGAAARTA